MNQLAVKYIFMTGHKMVLEDVNAVANVILPTNCSFCSILN